MRQIGAAKEPFDFLGITHSAHHFYRDEFLPETPNRLFFTVTFRYRGRPANDQWNPAVRLIVNGDSEVGYSFADISHSGYEEGVLRGEIGFRLVREHRDPSFELVIESEGKTLASVGLGHYKNTPLDADELVLENIRQGNLLRMPSEWNHLLDVGGGCCTNLVPGTLKMQPDQELFRHIAAMTAASAAQFGDPAFWTWKPSPNAGDANFVINNQYMRCANILAEELKSSYSLKFSETRAHNVPFAYFQTQEFCEDVGSVQPALVVFGFRPSTNIRVVADLTHLVHGSLVGRLAPADVARLSGTSSEAVMRSHNLSDLKKVVNNEVLEVPDREDLIGRLRAATRLGVFLNSEPQLVPFWIHFNSLDLIDNTHDDPMIAMIGAAARSIQARSGKMDPVLLLNLTPRLNPDFGAALALSPERLGVERTCVARIENVSHDSQIDDISGRAREPIVVLTPIDTYTEYTAGVLQKLRSGRREVLGMVTLVSAADVKPLHADWSSDFVPILRLVDQDGVMPRYELNPRLKDDSR